MLPFFTFHFLHNLQLGPCVGVDILWTRQNRASEAILQHHCNKSNDEAWGSTFAFFVRWNVLVQLSHSAGAKGKQ